MDTTKLPGVNALGLPMSAQSPMDAMTSQPEPTAQDTGQTPPSALNVLLNPKVSGSATLEERLGPQKSEALRKLSAGMNKAAQANPQAAAQPGGWARSVVAGVQSMLGETGDIAAVGTVQPGQGFLTGLARAAQAGQERKEGQRREDVRESQENQRLAMQQAETNMRLFSMVRNNYKQDTDLRDSMATQGKSYVDSMRANHDVQDNLTQGQLDDLIKSNKDSKEFWATHTGRVVGYEPVFGPDNKPEMDADGHPVMSPLYAVVNMQAKDGGDDKHVLSADDAAYLSRNLGQKFQEGSAVTQSDWNAYRVRADATQQTESQIRKANDDQLSSENLRQIQSEMQDPHIQHWIGSVAGQPIAGLEDGRDQTQDLINKIDQVNTVLKQKGGADDQIAKNLQMRQNAVDQLGKINHMLTYGFSTAAQEKYADWKQKQQHEEEIERHNEAEEKIHQAQADAKKKADNSFTGDFTKTGVDFLNTMDPESRAIVEQIGKGKMPINNLGYLISRNPKVAQAVAQAFPDFDGSKISSYVKTYQDFTSGKTSVALNAGGTALKHLNELDQLNTIPSRIYGTAAYNKFENKLDTVISELIKFYGMSDTDKSREALRHTLGGIANRDAAIREQARSMGDKLDSFEQTWSNAAPSKAYQAAMPFIDDAAKQARANLDPSYKERLEGQPPTGATMKVPGSDGQLHWSDGKNDLGVVQSGVKH